MAYQPKSYRKFLATSVAAAMVATVAAPMASANVTAPTFSDVVAGQYYTEAVTQMAAAEMINGIGGGKFGTTNELLRRDAAVLFSRSLLWDTKDVAAPAFTDVPAGTYYTDAIAKAVELGVINGKTATTFAPNDKLTRGDMAVLLQRALKLTVDPEVEVPFTDIEGKYYTEAVKAVYQAGLTTGATATTFNPNGTVTRAQFATFLYRSELVQENVKKEIERIEKEKAGNLEVLSVSAINLKQVVINFNKAVDATVAGNIANYEVFAQGALSTNLIDGTGAVATVSADGKSVTLTLENGANFANYSTANKVVVKKEVGLDANHTVSNLAANDTAVPTLNKAEATGPRTVVLTFSEPVQGTPANISLNGGAITLNLVGAQFNTARNTLTLTTWTDIPAGENTLTIGASNGITDFATYALQPGEVKFTHTPITVAPSVELVSSTETTATIKFSHEINPATLVGNANVLFSHTYNTAANRVTGTAVTNPSGDNKTFVVTFPTANPFPPGQSALYLSYASATATNIADNYNNKVAATTFTVNTVVDTVKPVVEGVQFINKNTVRVTFSEPVTAGTATNAANYTLKDATGTAVTVASADFHTGSTRVVNLTTSDINGGAHTLEVKEVVDRSIAGNKMDTVTVSFTAPDQVPPTVVDLVSGGATNGLILSGNKALITFSEPMDKASIEDAQNFRLGTGALPSGTTLSASADLRSVVITFPAATVLSGATINVGSVKDLAGNRIVALSTPVVLVADTGVAPTAVHAINKNQVKLTFNGTLTGIKASDFAVERDGTGTADPGWEEFASVANVEFKDGKTYITLTARGNFATGWTTAGTTPLVRSIAGGTPTEGAAASTTKDELGRSVNFAATTVTDKIAPEIVLRSVGGENVKDIEASLNSDGVINTITITFSEALQPLNAGATASTYATVEGFTVSNVTASSNTVVLTVAPKTGVNASATATPTVTLKNIADLGGNLIEELTGKAFVILP